MISKFLVTVDSFKDSKKVLFYFFKSADKFSSSVIMLNFFQLPQEFEYQPSIGQ